MSTRDYSSEQERYIAKITGGKLTPNSGGTKFSAGDILTEHFLIEAKTTTKETKSVSIKKGWLEKAKKQAFEMGKEGSFLAFNFEPCGENYYVMSEDLFLKALANLSNDVSTVSVADYVYTKGTNIDAFRTFANGILVEICKFADNNNINKCELLRDLAGGLNLASRNPICVRRIGK